MRTARIKVNGRRAVYHCISRIVGGAALLGDLEKDRLRLMLWQQVAFSGLTQFEQRSSKWYNHQHHRFGTLRAERIKGLVVENQPSGL